MLNPMQKSQGKTRFLSLLSSMDSSIPETSLIHIWEDLEAHYMQPQRKYHTLNHVLFCLDRFDECSGYISACDQLELAIWFHDAIYFPGSNLNEAQSANYFDHHLKRWLSDADIKAVTKLIMVTNMTTLPATNDQAFMCDIDLSSFGLSWIDFLMDSVALREEQADVATNIFAKNKRHFLNHLLDRESIFITEHFYSLYEQQARKNIKRYLTVLNSQAIN